MSCQKERFCIGLLKILHQLLPNTKFFINTFLISTFISFPVKGAAAQIAVPKKPRKITTKNNHDKDAAARQQRQSSGEPDTPTNF